jgi:hypothetical protein
MRGVVVCKSRDVVRVEHAGIVLNLKGKENEGVGRKKGYRYLISCDFLVQLALLVNEHKLAPPSSGKTTTYVIS